MDILKALFGRSPIPNGPELFQISREGKQRGANGNGLDLSVTVDMFRVWSGSIQRPQRSGITHRTGIWSAAYWALRLLLSLSLRLSV